MDALRILGAFMVVPATILLTISFFVVITLKKLDKGFVRALGMVAVVMLWTSVLLVLSAGIYFVSLKDYCYFKELRKVYGYPHAQMFERYHGRYFQPDRFMGGPHHKAERWYRDLMEPDCSFTEPELDLIPEDLQK